MQTIETFFETHINSPTNVVGAFYKGEQVATFSSSEPLFDAVLFLNNLLKNFRLTGVTMVMIFEPTLKEMGLLALSRVDRVLFLKKHAHSAPDIWDRFVVHQVEKTQYAN